MLDFSQLQYLPQNVLSLSFRVPMTSSGTWFFLKFYTLDSDRGISPPVLFTSKGSHTVSFCELICELPQDPWENCTKIVFWQRPFPTSRHLFLIVLFWVLCIAFVMYSTQLVVICLLIYIDLLGCVKQLSVCSNTTRRWTKCIRNSVHLFWDEK